jgi:pantoate--beta-alanine ligase
VGKEDVGITMQIIRTIKDMQALSKKLRAGHKTIGIVPTMGALHEGHLSLIRSSKNDNDITVVTIFVNPVQFGPHEDFKKYPRDTEGDLNKLSSVKADIVFLPDDNEMYPDGFATFVDIGSIGKILCGASRPEHFNGVATVVVKLFNIVMPDNAYFGQKDFQQTVIIKKIVTDLDYNINIIVCPIVRENDGLAMSSRNTYLDHEERKAASILYKALQLVKELILSNPEIDVLSVKEQIKEHIISEPLANIDYIEIVNIPYLEKVMKINSPVAICIAVKIGKTRLIDNMIVEKK